MFGTGCLFGSFFIRARVGGNGHRVNVWPRRRISWIRGMVVRCQIKVPYRILALDLDIHRPALEIYLAPILARDNPLLRCTTGFISHAFLKARLVLKPHLLATNFDSLASICSVRCQPGVWVRHRHTRGRRRVLWRRKAHIRKGADRLPVCSLDDTSLLFAKTVLAISLPSRIEAEVRSRPFANRHSHNDTALLDRVRSFLHGCRAIPSMTGTVAAPTSPILSAGCQM